MNRDFVIMGPPSSGKTTFLAALWHLIESGEITPQLSLERLDGEQTYLHQIADAWRRCTPVPHTSMQSETTASMHVRVRSSQQPAVLTFPDLSGETFNRQVEERRCTEQYVERHKSASGLMLFVNADRREDDVRLADINAMTASDVPSTGPVDAPPQPEGHEWAPKFIPQQVRLVELLQFLQQSPFEPRRRRLVLVVSAWDVIPAPTPTPALWVRRNLPLLDQFLKTNGDSFESVVYGVSAQGGDFADPDQVTIIAKKTPSERIQCVGPDETNHDLTTPLQWLMKS